MKGLPPKGCFQHRGLGVIKCGADVVREALLYLLGLCIEPFSGIEVLPDCTHFLALTDVYRVPAFEADDLICFEKLSEDFMEYLSALDVLTAKGVEHLVEMAFRHGHLLAHRTYRSPFRPASFRRGPPDLVVSLFFT